MMYATYSIRYFRHCIIQCSKDNISKRFPFHLVESEAGWGGGGGGGSTLKVFNLSQGGGGEKR